MIAVGLIFLQQLYRKHGKSSVDKCKENTWSENKFNTELCVLTDMGRFLAPFSVQALSVR